METVPVQKTFMLCRTLKSVPVKKNFDAVQNIENSSSKKNFWCCARTLKTVPVKSRYCVEHWKLFKYETLMSCMNIETVPLQNTLMLCKDIENCSSTKHFDAVQEHWKLFQCENTMHKHHKLFQCKSYILGYCGPLDTIPVWHMNFHEQL